MPEPTTSTTRPFLLRLQLWLITGTVMAIAILLWAIIANPALTIRLATITQLLANLAWLVGMPAALLFLAAGTLLRVAQLRVQRAVLKQVNRPGWELVGMSGDRTGITWAVMMDAGGHIRMICGVCGWTDQLASESEVPPCPACAAKGYKEG